MEITIKQKFWKNNANNLIKMMFISDKLSIEE